MAQKCKGTATGQQKIAGAQQKSPLCGPGQFLAVWTAARRVGTASGAALYFWKKSLMRYAPQTGIRTAIALFPFVLSLSKGYLK